MNLAEERSINLFLYDNPIENLSKFELKINEW